MDAAGAEDREPPLRSAATCNVMWGGAAAARERRDQDPERIVNATHTWGRANGTAVQANRNQSSGGRDWGGDFGYRGGRCVISGVSGRSGMIAS